MKLQQARTSDGYPSLPSGRFEPNAMPVLPQDTLVLLKEWWEYLQVSTTGRTPLNYWRAIERFLRSVRKPLLEVEEHEVVSFLAAYPPRSASRQLHYYALRHLFAFMTRRSYILFNPLADVPSPKPTEHEPEALTSAELIRVLVAAGNRSQLRGLAVLLLYYTGLRISEALALRWPDAGSENLMVREAKGGRQRVIPISAGLRTTLEMLRAHRVDDRVLPRCQASVSAWLREAGEEAGLEVRVHPHLLRSTFATTIFERGGNGTMHTVQSLLGHRKLQTTARYLAVVAEDRRKAVGLL